MEGWHIVLYVLICSGPAGIGRFLVEQHLCYAALELLAQVYLTALPREVACGDACLRHAQKRQRADIAHRSDAREVLQRHEPTEPVAYQVDLVAVACCLYQLYLAPQRRCGVFHGLSPVVGEGKERLAVDMAVGRKCIYEVLIQVKERVNRQPSVGLPGVKHVRHHNDRGILARKFNPPLPPQ